MRKANSLAEKIILKHINVFVENNIKKIKRGNISHSPLRVLDIGCGEQPYRQIIEECGFEYYGLDVSPRGNVKLSYSGMIDDPDLKLLLSGLQFDLLLLTEVIEHVDHHDTMWKNLNKLTLPGGSILLTAPFLYPLHEEPWDSCRPTIMQIERYAKLYGFEVLQAQRAGSTSDVLSLILAVLSHSNPKSVAGKFLILIARCLAQFSHSTQILNMFTSNLYLSNLLHCKKCKVVE